MNKKELIGLSLLLLLVAGGTWALNQRRQEKETRQNMEAIKKELKKTADKLEKSFFDNLPEPGENEKG